MKPIMITLMYLTFGGDIKLDTFEIQQECSSWFHSNITSVEKQKNGLLRNKSFLVTGKLNGISRAEIKSLIEENSGSTLSSVSSKLDYLITGEKPTKRKVESAKQLKIKIINQNHFLKMLKKTS